MSNNVNNVVKGKFEIDGNEINALDTIAVTLIKTAYGTCLINFDLTSGLTHTEKISNVNYFIALSENKVDVNKNKNTWLVPHRFVKGLKEDGTYWYAIELFISNSFRPRIFITDAEMKALKVANITKDFKEIKVLKTKEEIKEVKIN